MKQPAASPGRAEKPPGLARLLLSKSRRGARSRRAPATSPMFVSRGRSRAAAADGEPSSPKVTCIGQVRMRKGKKGPPAPPPPPPAKEEKARGYCRCLKKAFLCGGLFDFDRKHRRKGPAPEAERTRRSPWVFSSRDVAVAAAPKPPDPASDCAEKEGEEDDKSVERDEKADEPGTDSGAKEEEEDEEGETAELVSSATTTPPKNALLLMRCRSAPQNRSSPLISRFAAVAGPGNGRFRGGIDRRYATSGIPLPAQAGHGVTLGVSLPAQAGHAVTLGVSLPAQAGHVAVTTGVALSPQAGHGVRGKGRREREAARNGGIQAGAGGEDARTRSRSRRRRGGGGRRSGRDEVLVGASAGAAEVQVGAGDDRGGEDGGRCGGRGAPSGCFWANGGSSGRRRHAPQMSPAAGAPVALTGH